MKHLSRIIPLSALALLLAGCSAPSLRTWFIQLSPNTRGFIIVGVLALPLVIFVFAKMARVDWKLSQVYLVYAGILIVLGLLWLAISVLWLILSTVVLWIIALWAIIAIVLISIVLLFLMLGIITGTVPDGDKLSYFLWFFTLAFVDTLLILYKLNKLSGLLAKVIPHFTPSLPGGLLLLAVVALLVFMIVAVVKALSVSYPPDTYLWFFGGLAALVAAGVLIPSMVRLLFPQALPNLPQVSVAYLAFSGYAFLIGIFVFPVQIARAFYRIFENDEVVITQHLKPAVQNQYKTMGYQCGRCGGSLPGPVATCPHCGVRFNSSQNKYYGPKPKEEKTTVHHTASWAGFFLILLLVLDMLHSIALFALRGSLLLSGSSYQTYLFGWLVANLIILLVSIPLIIRYKKIHGDIVRTSYY